MSDVFPNKESDSKKKPSVINSDKRKSKKKEVIEDPK